MSVIPFRSYPESHYNAGVRYGENIILAAFAREIVLLWRTMAFCRRIGSRDRADAYRGVLVDFIRLHRALRGRA